MSPHPSALPSPSYPPNFGIVIACCDQDLLFAKGCCASIRYFCGDVPICMIVDGNVSVEPLIRTYGVTALYANDIPDIRLRAQSFGFGLTKMIALWHAPWERFLFLDSDTVMWGNVSEVVAGFEDAFIDQHIGGHTEADIDEFYFRIAPFEKRFPQINWRRRQADYFCSGVFALRRGVFDVDEYLRWLAVMRENPDLIKPGDQTPLNLMIFRAADSGEITLRSSEIQWVTHGADLKLLQDRFPFVDGAPSDSGAPVVIHWAGAKPVMDNARVYPEPMTYFRRKYLKDSYCVSGPTANVVLRIEDQLHKLLTVKNKVRRIAGKLISKVRGRFRSSRRRD